MTRQFHRPVLMEPAEAERYTGAEDTAATSALAHQSAQLLIGGYLGADTDTTLNAAGLRKVVASHGVDVIGELWATSPAGTLPGALWRLLLLREWIERDPALVESRYATAVTINDDDAAAQARFEAALSQGQRVDSVAQVQAQLNELLLGGGSADSQRTSSRRSQLYPTLLASAALLERLSRASEQDSWITDENDPLYDVVTSRARALATTAAELREAASKAAVGKLD